MQKRIKSLRNQTRASWSAVCLSPLCLRRVGRSVVAWVGMGERRLKPRRTLFIQGVSTKFNTLAPPQKRPGRLLSLFECQGEAMLNSKNQKLFGQNLLPDWSWTSIEWRFCKCRRPFNQTTATTTRPGRQ